MLTPFELCLSEERPNRHGVMTAGGYYSWRVKRQKELWRVEDDKGDSDERVQDSSRSYVTY